MRPQRAAPAQGRALWAWAAALSPVPPTVTTGTDRVLVHEFLLSLYSKLYSRCVYSDRHIIEPPLSVAKNSTQPMEPRLVSGGFSFFNAFAIFYSPTCGNSSSRNCCERARCPIVPMWYRVGVPIRCQGSPMLIGELCTSLYNSSRGRPAIT